MISILLHLVDLQPRVYYTLTNFRGRGQGLLGLPPHYANDGGVIWCVLEYILIRFCFKKFKKYIFYTKVVIFSYTLNCWSMTVNFLHHVGLRLQVYHIQFLEGNKVPLAFPLNTPEHFCLFYNQFCLILYGRQWCSEGAYTPERRPKGVVNFYCRENVNRFLEKNMKT